MVVTCVQHFMQFVKQAHYLLSAGLNFVTGELLCCCCCSVRDDPYDTEGRRCDQPARVLDCGDYVWSLDIGTGHSYPSRKGQSLLWRRFSFSDEIILAVGLQKGHIKLWDCRTGRLLLLLVFSFFFLSLQTEVFISCPWQLPSLSLPFRFCDCPAFSFPDFLTVCLSDVYIDVISLNIVYEVLLKLISNSYKRISIWPFQVLFLFYLT